MISLLSKGQDDILVHVVMYSDDNDICQAFPNCLEYLCGRFEEILPSTEDEGIVDSVRLGKEGASVVARFCDRDNFALTGLIERIGCIALQIVVLVSLLSGDRTRYVPSRVDHSQ